MTSSDPKDHKTYCQETMFRNSKLVYVGELFESPKVLGI